MCEKRTGTTKNEENMKDKSIIPNIITAAIVGCAAIALVAYAVAPERTRSGDYTNPIKYFFSAEYRCKNFGDGCSKIYQGCTTDASCYCMAIFDGRVSHAKAVKACK